MDDTGWLLLVLCILLGIALVGWPSGAVEGLLVILCLLLHEFGHMLTAVALGVPVSEFGLCVRGAYNRRAHSGRRRTEILISFSGPLMNLFLAFPSHYVPVIGNQLALYNIMLCIVNLLPIPSSDGLRILRNLQGSTADQAAVPSLSDARVSLPVEAE
jgi:Zn-dependent protease